MIAPHTVFGKRGRRTGSDAEHLSGRQRPYLLSEAFFKNAGHRIGLFKIASELCKYFVPGYTHRDGYAKLKFYPLSYILGYFLGTSEK